uniref:Uncharacterized protein n=1 Tax=Rhizophora mucronata TaxID=61149 RepID=A0A2P2Q5D7_RHIMU
MKQKIEREHCFTGALNALVDGVRGFKYSFRQKSYIKVSFVL